MGAGSNADRLDSLADRMPGASILMITAFWVLFALAVLILAACLFMYLLIPIVLIGVFVLIVSHCGGSHGRGVVETTHSNSVEHTNYHRGNGGAV